MFKTNSKFHLMEIVLILTLRHSIQHNYNRIFLVVAFLLLSENTRFVNMEKIAHKLDKLNSLCIYSIHQLNELIVYFIRTHIK